MRKLSLVIAGILGAGTPLISQAATLGEARVQSYLSQPLDVRVPLARSSDEPLDEITVKLAPASFYREAGVSLQNITGNLTFTIESDRGQEYVLIGSKRPIRDPILSILLEVDSPQGRMIREYNLLLDPPSMGSTQGDRSGGATTSNQAVAPTSTTQAPSRSSPATSSWQRVEPAQDVPLDGTRDVQSGDTLYEIAREYVADGADVRPMMQAIIDANPQAFANGNGNALMAGARLRVPDTGASPTSTDQAEPDNSASDSVTEIERLPALELLGPEEEGGERAAVAPATLGDFGGLTREQPLAAIAGGTQSSNAQDERETLLDREEVESARAESEALTEQLRALKDQIDTVKLAVDQRDAQIAELQQVIEQSRAELASAERASGNFWMEWGKYLTGVLGLVIIALLIALGLRRNRPDEEPGVPMPVTAGASNQPAVDHDPVVEPPRSTTTASTVAGSAAVTGAAAAGVAYAPTDSDPDHVAATPASGMDDPMNPEMALEEARVLESFNLTHQAEELLQDSLAEHPGHSGLQSALNRLKGIDAGETGDELGDSQPQDDDSTWTAEGDESVGESAGPEEATGVPVDSTAWDETPESTDEWEADDQPQASSGGEWDDDIDDMLATPEPETSPVEDEESMDFDDSFALETPAKEPSANQVEDVPSPHEPNELELPANETPPASVDTPESDSETDEPAPLDLDLSGYEPAGERGEPTASGDQDMGMDLDLDQAPSPEEPAEDEPASTNTDEETASSAGDESDIDTRVGLAEAFLDVGDRESFDMIKAELQEEGTTAALERLDELENRHPG
ncbi:FimV/HubP family polar landmark protein [Guyparkeria halopsychrophila]|uniref:FimV/HubP family polar landmark protein n=1 Tax=Guyparkeria halopsychrophila TaxID=3139421 RepID=UPI0037CCB320